MEMIKNVLMVKDIYPHDTISTNNDNAWKKIKEALNNQERPIMLDFKGIELVKPWLNQEFVDILKDERVYFRVYNIPDMDKNVRTICMLDGLQEERVIHVIQSHKYVEKSEKKNAARARAKEYANKIELRNQAGKIYGFLKYGYDQLGNESSVEYIFNGIRLKSEESGIKDYTVDFGSIFIIPAVINIMAIRLAEFKREGIHIEIVSEDKEIMKKLYLYKDTENSKNISAGERRDTFLRELKENTVGVLVQYRSSKTGRLDEFGRTGEGRVLSSRIAIYKNKVDKSGTLYFMFETFSEQDFYTREHIALTNDGVIPKYLERTEVWVSEENLGLFDSFLGKTHHFSLPIQFDVKDMSKIHSFVGASVKVFDVALPIRIKEVLDDWEEEYNEEILNEAMSATKEIFDKANMQMKRVL